MSDLEQLIASLVLLDAQATPAPWSVSHGSGNPAEEGGESAVYFAASFVESCDRPMGEADSTLLNAANANLIAALRNAFAEIVNGVDDLRRQLVVMTQCHKSVCDDNEFRAREYASLSAERYALKDRIAALEGERDAANKHASWATKVLAESDVDGSRRESCDGYIAAADALDASQRDRITKLEGLLERATAFVELVHWDGAVRKMTDQRNICIACGKLQHMHQEPCLVTNLLAALEKP